MFRVRLLLHNPTIHSMSASRFFSNADTGIRVSKKQLDEFLTRLAKDDSLRGDFGEDYVTPAKVVEVAARHGFDFTLEELSASAQPLTEEEWADAARRFGRNHTDSLHPIPGGGHR